MDQILVAMNEKLQIVNEAENQAAALGMKVVFGSLNNSCSRNRLQDLCQPVHHLFG